MRFKTPLSHILDNETKVICLRLLCNYPTAISGRQLAKIVEINPTTVNKALNSLLAEQIILVRKVGKAHIYELNKTHWLVTKLLIPLFKQEGALLSELLSFVVREIKQSQINKEIVSIVLFGSVHEHNEAPASDVDLFIVVKEAKYKKRVEDIIFSIDAKLMPMIGMGIEPYIKTIAEFKKDQQLSVTKSILRSHQVVWGQSLEKLL
ncbi:MAG: nucleotidyltransferase domain-containing protein [Candidatus Omnitrophica bacterium]|nr:nucleotidyltransferase domain-containing protein [Candidatus Omnitrophota bacterium]